MPSAPLALGLNRPNPLPRWRGFNLLDKFWPNPRRPESRRRPFQEREFRWISDWGFDFVRLPMSYLCWATAADPFTYDESVLAQVDQAVAWGERHGVHVCLNLHRAPGYCIGGLDAAGNLWADQRPQDAFVAMWEHFSRRYDGIPSARLSFDLVNEPPSPGELGMTSVDQYDAIVRRTVTAIRAIDPGRLVIIDGTGGGNQPMPSLVDTGVAQSCRGYLPMGVSHWKAGWCGTPGRNPPRWPGGEHYREIWDRGTLARHYDRWEALIEAGVGVHCGEMGCYNQTPHAIALAWLEDVFAQLRQRRIGWALWNLRGDFGILDNRRADAPTRDWHGLRLDTDLLRLLQRS